MELRDFAEELGKIDYGDGKGPRQVPHTTVDNYEKGPPDGSAKVPHAYIAAVCCRFRVNPRWLLWGEEPYELVDPSDAEELAATEEERKRVLRAATEAEIEDLKKMLAAISEPEADRPEGEAQIQADEARREEALAKEQARKEAQERQDGKGGS